jgi:hypothetical protein
MAKEIMALLCQMNSASLGSFGEAIFLNVAERRGWLIEKRHTGQVDYHINGEPVDVKTTRQTLHTQISRRRYRARLENVRYALVEFIATGASISLDGTPVASFEWEEIHSFWDKWIAQRGGEDGLFEAERSGVKERVASLKRDLGRFFAEEGIKTRIIYRTCQTGFKQESPHNLKPNSIEPNRVTIYLNFKDKNIVTDNLNAIYAFPDTAVATLPMLDRTRLHLPKVDLNKMPPRFIFQTLDELREEFRRIFT